MDDKGMDKRGISKETIEELERWADRALNSAAIVELSTEAIDNVVKILGIRPDGSSYTRDIANVVRFFVDEIEKVRRECLLRGLSFYAEFLDKPMRDGEPLEGWLNRWYYERPLDADGNPWKIGDECVTPEGAEGTVSGYRPGGGVLVMFPTGSTRFYYAPDLVRPLLDADGVRIRKGDTVWDLDSGEKLLVVELSNREHGLVQCSNEEDGGCEDHDARRLTHREPDSLEKLRDDIMGAADELEDTPWQGTHDRLLVMADRLTAFMER